MKDSPFFLLAVFANSLANSWHCSLMCGGLFLQESKEQSHQILVWRMISYSAMGALMGGLGQAFLDSPDWQLIRAIGFLAVFVLSLIFIFPWLLPSLFPPWSGFKKLIFLRPFPRVRGLLMGLMPCHLLAFLYSLAVLSASPWVGGALLFGHSVMTVPALAYAWRGAAKVFTRYPGSRRLLKAMLLIVVVLNLFYFAGLLIHAEGVENRLLFCL